MVPPKPLSTELLIFETSIPELRLPTADKGEPPTAVEASKKTSSKAPGTASENQLPGVDQLVFAAVPDTAVQICGPASTVMETVAGADAAKPSKTVNEKLSGPESPDLGV